MGQEGKFLILQEFLDFLSNKLRSFSTVSQNQGVISIKIPLTHSESVFPQYFLLTVLFIATLTLHLCICFVKMGNFRDLGCTMLMTMVCD